MGITVCAVEEYNDKGFLIYAENYPGAYVRGNTREVALSKFQREIKEYLSWKYGMLQEEASVWVDIVESRSSTLEIQDADSDVIFAGERKPLTEKEYQELKSLALKSAADFYQLYLSIPDKNSSKLPVRKTFYGTVPRTAEEMYQHTKNVNSYYFGEIGVEIGNEPDIRKCREEGFSLLEEQMDYLENHLYHGSYGETWSLRKVLRRFIWHDRIHAKAMYRMANQTFGKGIAANPFLFSETGHIFASVK